MADEDTRHMAVNEIKIANKHAKHAEHLVRTVDAYFHNDKICIAMEFADGVRRQPSPPCVVCLVPASRAEFNAILSHL